MFYLEWETIEQEMTDGQARGVARAAVCDQLRVSTPHVKEQTQGDNLAKLREHEVNGT